VKQLYFVRHGQSELNKARRWAGHVDTPLTMVGHTQAMHTGRQMKQQNIRIDAIISSPLQRAHDTARHIATHIEYPHDDIQIHPGFVERHYGVIDGRQHRRARIHSNMVGEKALDKYEGAEKLADMQQRADEMLAYLNTLPFDNILVVAHGTFGRALRRAVHNEPLYHRGERIGNAQLIRFI
jgi:probable phosphoglycerate mutase